MILNRKLSSLIGRRSPTDVLGSEETKNYWSEHNVSLHREFESAEDSLAYFRWRNDQYFNYIELMPVTGQDGKVVLDFGCGPGHDLVGFATESRPKRLIGADISTRSMAEAKDRLSLHDSAVELVTLDPSSSQLPFESASVDYIHSSGVLHHTPNPDLILAEFRRILAPGGCARIMVYNYDSLWLHLYVAYQKCLVEGQLSDSNIRDAFSKTTDGEDCPISNVYRPEEFIELAASANLEAKFTGAAISMHECSLFLTLRFQAIQDERLREESRKFLIETKLNSLGYPTYRNSYAGVDGCYFLEPDSPGKD